MMQGIELEVLVSLIASLARLHRHAGVHALHLHSSVHYVINCMRTVCLRMNVTSVSVQLILGRLWKLSKRQRYVHVHQQPTCLCNNLFWIMLVLLNLSRRFSDTQMDVRSHLICLYIEIRIRPGVNTTSSISDQTASTINIEITNLCRRT
jgi:hypothetical protein